MLRILKHLRWKEWLLVAACVVLIVGQVQLDLALPDYMSEITRLVQTEGSQMSDILLAGGKMLLCALGSMLLTVCTTFFTAQIASRFSARLRGEMYRKVVGFSNEEPLLHSQPDYPHDQRHFAIADVLFLRDAVAD